MRQLQAIGTSELICTMTLRNLLGKVSRRLRLRDNAFDLLDAAAFERAAMGERMRVDRNGSVLAILLVSVPTSVFEQLPALGRVLTERLRLTDTIGLLRDGRIGVLLPDTPLAGAWKVAEDVSGLIGGGGGRVDCEVHIYPDDSPGTPWKDRETTQEPEPVGANPAAAGGVSFARSSGPVDAVFARPMPWWKRATDVVVGCVGLALASPVIAVSAVAVAATSEGGPFFLQQREGLAGRRFNIYKIRTMTADAEAQKSDLRRHSEQDGPAFKMASDPRVTPVGRVLRALSIDELPQLLNVVLGDMSLVGPRPLPVEESQECEPWQRQRLLVTPGITCTWQVRGRNIVPFDEWVRMDLQYARERSLWSDVKLLAETGPSLIMSKGPR